MVPKCQKPKVAIAKAIAKALEEDEKLWVKVQNILHGEKLKRDAKKAKHHLLYNQSLLAKCKKYGDHSILQKRSINA